MPESPAGACAAVVLAAGASRRLGQPKQLVRQGDETLLRRTARLAVEAGCAPVVVVLGFEAERMRPELAGLPVQVLEHPAWAEGMGSSLRCGVAAVLSGDTGSPPDGVLLLVCDQPRLSRQHLLTLLDRHRTRGAPLTASLYAGRAGVPAVFAPEVFPELLAVEGDRGAREVIRAWGERVETVPWPDGAFDLDLPEDFDRID